MAAAGERIGQLIHLEADAAAYIQSRGGHVMLRRSARHGCCGGRVYLPVVDLGRPADGSHYVSLEQQGVTIHVERPLLFTWRDPLTVEVTGFWRWHTLWVEGAEASM